MSLFTACSDDEDNSWKEIPTEEIDVANDNVTVNINGTTSTTGSVQMTVKNESEAILNLKNVIPGYAEVPVNVELQKQSDGSFNFAGESNLTTPPAMTRNEASAPAIFVVSVDGNITKDGKVKVTATSELSEQAQGGLAGTWNLLNSAKLDENEMITKAPLWITWSAKDANQPNLSYAAYVINVFGSPIIYNLLNNVTFNVDGNITANYSTAELSMETVLGYIGAMEGDDNGTNHWIHMNTKWADSPKNLAYWYTQGELLYILPDIAAIMQQVATDSGSEGASNIDLASLIKKLAEYNIDITALLPSITEWMSTGVPLKYKVSSDGMKVYVDKAMAAPFIEALLPALPALQEQINAIFADPAQAETAFMIRMVFGLLNISDLNDIVTVWKDNTDEFEIALNLIK